MTKNKLGILMCLLLLLAGKALAGDGVRIEPFEIAAGETKEVDIVLDDAEEVYCGLQFDLYLPAGVEIAYDEEYGEYMCYATSRTLERSHTLTIDRKEDADGAFYRFLVYDMKNRNIGSGEIYTLTLVADDMISTGVQMASFKDVVLSDENQNGPELAEVPFEVTCTIPLNVSSLGYASFSWPRALDFADSGMKAFIITAKSPGMVSLEEVEKVPAGTGLILKADEGCYYPQTTDEATNNVDKNMLTGTSSQSYTVDADNIFVLSNLSDGQAGLYQADVGVNIAKYKAYMKLNGNEEAKNGLAFDFQAAGIDGIKSARSYQQVYSVDGRRVAETGRLAKGIFIVNGKKVRMK